MNGWGDMWRNGIYPLRALSLADPRSARASRAAARKVRFGGEQGQELEITQGDVALLPAGTGHQCLWASPDLMVIGAYPPDGRYDLCRGSKAEHAKALQSIPKVPLPEVRSGLRRERSAAGAVAEVTSFSPLPPRERFGNRGLLMADWISFWNSDHPIYVNARHRDVHYRGIADDVSGYVTPGAAVLDYGCGEAVHADRVAAKAGRLILCEAAPERARASRCAIFLRKQHRGEVAGQVAALPAGSLDLIVMHSVAQYLSQEETDALFAQFRRLLKPGGLFVLGDVIPPHVSPVADAMALLRFAAANGFLIAAFTALVRTTFSDYPKLRAKLGLTLYEESRDGERSSRPRAFASTARRKISATAKRA